MGLQFSHTDACWTYSGFMTFRRMVAEEAGINLFRTKEYGGVTSLSTYKDDIVPFLAHSDCEGILTPDECKRIAPRLKELVLRIQWPYHHDLEMKNALSLVQGMEDAARKGENLIFC